MRNPRAFIALIPVGLLLAPIPALAQEAVPVEKLEAITVKGNKEGKTYSESHESISLVEERFLNEAGRQNSLEALNAVPNVQVSRGGETFSIRGINNTGVTGFQKDNLASLFVDDVFQTELAAQAGSFNLWDSESVEIHRGAQSTTQGVNSLAGSILLYRAAPRFETGGMAKLGYGSFDRKEVGLAVEQVLVPETLSARIAYDKEWGDGYITNVGTGNRDWGARNRDSVNLGVSYRPTERDRFRLNAKFQHVASGGTYVQGEDVSRYEVNENWDYRLATRNGQASLRYERDLSDELSNQVMAAYSASGQHSSSDGEGTDQNLAGLRFERHDDDFASLENLIVYQSGRIKNVLGFHGHYFKLLDDYEFSLLYPVGASVTPIAVEQQVDRRRVTLAVFDSFLLKLDSFQSISAGARVERAQNTYSTAVSAARTANLGGATNAAVDAYLAGKQGDYEGKKSDVVVLPTLAYLVELGPHHLGLSYTRGYRTSGVSINRSRAQAVAYGAEFTHNYELSYKRPGQAVSLSSSAFYVDWRDQQVTVQRSTDFFDTEVQNASRSRVLGAEAQAELKLGERQSVAYGVGYSRTRFESFVNGGLDYKGRQFPFASNWTSQLTHRITPWDRLTFTTVARFLSPYFTNPENTRSAPSQFYLDLNAQYTLGPFLGELYVKNLLDRTYRTVDGTPSNTASPLYRYHQANAPRELGARLTYFW